MLLNLLDIQYSAEFFRTVDEKQDVLLDFAEDYEPIKAFFKGDQIDIWNRSLKLIKIYDDSKTFIVNGEIEAVVEEVKSISYVRCTFRFLNRPIINKLFWLRYLLTSKYVLHHSTLILPHGEMLKLIAWFPVDPA